MDNLFHSNLTDCGCGCGGHEEGIASGGNSKMINAARKFLLAFPEGSKPGRIASHILGIKNAPSGLSDKLINDLLAGHNEFEFSGGLWKLADVEFTKLENVPFIVVDVETTGGRAETCRVMEIGAFRVFSGTVTASMMTLINPHAQVPLSISMLTGIYPEHLKNAPEIEDVLPKFINFIKGGVFVGHNATFDFSFMNAELKRNGFPAMKNEVICTIKLSRRIFPGQESYGLDNMIKFMGLELERSERHRGHGDAWATAELLLRCLAALQAAGISSLEELLTFQAMPVKKARKKLNLQPFSS